MQIRQVNPGKSLKSLLKLFCDWKALSLPLFCILLWGPKTTRVMELDKLMRSQNSSQTSKTCTIRCISISLCFQYVILLRSQNNPSHGIRQRYQISNHVIDWCSCLFPFFVIFLRFPIHAQSKNWTSRYLNIGRRSQNVYQIDIFECTCIAKHFCLSIYHATTLCFTKNIYFLKSLTSWSMEWASKCLNLKTISNIVLCVPQLCFGGATTQ